MTSAAQTLPARTFGQHMRASIVLGAPLVAAQLAQMIIHITDTVMLGWLGVEELAAGTLAGHLVFLALIFALGFGAAMMPLIAGALGRDDERSVRRSARMGLWALVIMAIVLMIPLTFTEEILLALGQDATVSRLADDYMVVGKYVLVPGFLLVGLRSFLTALEKANTVLILTLIAAVLNGLLNYALIFGNWGAPALGIVGAAWATVITNTLATVGAAVFCVINSETARYDLFTRFWRADWPVLKTVFGLGVPISLTILAEAGLFTASSIMMGWIGTVELAAHGIALQIASLAFMVPMGLAQAASVRVGNAVGRNDWQGVGDAAHAIIVLAIGFAVLSAITMVAIPKTLAGFFLDADNPDAPAVLLATVPLLFMAAAFQIVDGAQAVTAGALRGLQDTRVPMVMAVIAYWPVGTALSYVLAFPFNWGAVGIWAGLVIGLAVASVLLLWRFIGRNRFGLTPA